MHLDGTIDQNVDHVEALSQLLERVWPAIASARQSAIKVRRLLADSLVDKSGPFSSSDVDIVVFGSLARGEWTSGSDVDWTLLIDGQATPEHRTVARKVRETIDAMHYEGKKLKLPPAQGI